MTCPPSPGALALQYLALLLSLLAALTAWLLAQRRTDHRPVAVGLGIVCAGDLLGTGLHAIWTELNCPGPYLAEVRFAFHVDQAAHLLWPAAIVGMATIVVWRLRRSSVLCWVGFAWATVLVVMVLQYPALRGDPLRKVYLMHELVALAVGVASFCAWNRRGAWRTGAPSPAVLVVGLIIGTELAALAVGPWARGLFGSAYQLQQVMLAVLFATVAAVQGGSWWRLRSRS